MLSFYSKYLVMLQTGLQISDRIVDVVNWLLITECVKSAVKTAVALLKNHTGSDWRTSGASQGLVTVTAPCYQERFVTHNTQEAEMESNLFILFFLFSLNPRNNQPYTTHTNTQISMYGCVFIHLFPLAGLWEWVLLEPTLDELFARCE